MARRGALCAVAGIVIPVRQMEWIGILALLYACLRWALPPFSGGIRCWRCWFSTGFIRCRSSDGTIQVGCSGCRAGAEWLLHCAKRGMADGFVLRVGGAVLGCRNRAAGCGRRPHCCCTGWGWRCCSGSAGGRCCSFCCFGPAQAVALNVLRIAFLVAWAPRMPPEWGQTFLHDTMGMLLLSGSCCCNWSWRGGSMEGAASRVRDAIASGESEPPDKGSWLPNFWWREDMAWLIVLAALVTGARDSRLQRRPSHRVRCGATCWGAGGHGPGSGGARGGCGAASCAGRSDVLRRRALVLGPRGKRRKP